MRWRLEDSNALPKTACTAAFFANCFDFSKSTIEFTRAVSVDCSSIGKRCTLSINNGMLCFNDDGFDTTIEQNRPEKSTKKLRICFLTTRKYEWKYEIGVCRWNLLVVFWQFCYYYDFCCCCFFLSFFCYWWCWYCWIFNQLKSHTLTASIRNSLIKINQPNIWHLSVRFEGKKR